jgi:hypothetical protein
MSMSQMRLCGDSTGEELLPELTIASEFRLEGPATWAENSTS